MEADEAAIKNYEDAVATLSRAQEALRTSRSVACERYDAAARLVKWDNHFIANHKNRCALGGTRDTAVSRAEGRSSDDKGKVVTVDERSRIRPINNVDGRQHCMGIYFSASLREEVLAFETAALRDEWVSWLTYIPAAAAAVLTAQQRVEILLPSKHLALQRKEERAKAAKAAAEAERQARLSIVYNGHVYKSLADHDPHSTTIVSEHDKLYSLDPAWELCPNTPDALHVCRTYPWATFALIFADGSVHYTKLAPSLSCNPSLTPGTCAHFSGTLVKTRGQYGADAGSGWWHNAGSDHWRCRPSSVPYLNSGPASSNWRCKSPPQQQQTKGSPYNSHNAPLPLKNNQMQGTGCPPTWMDGTPGSPTSHPTSSFAVNFESKKTNRQRPLNRCCSLL